MKSFFLLFVLLIVAIQFGLAQSLPPFPGIRIQGSLTTNLGQPITGSHDVTIRIYTQQTGGLPIYAQVYSGLTINKGILDVIVNVSGLPFDSLYWAETQLDNEVFLPRTQLLSVPYSFHALKADTSLFARAAFPFGVAGGGLSGQYPNPAIADSSLTASKFKKGTFDSIGSGLYLHTAGGTMTGAITNVGNPPITMGKGNFGVSNGNSGLDAFVAGVSDSAKGDYSIVGGGSNNITRSTYSTIGGGTGNITGGLSTQGVYSIIGGGSGNIAFNMGATISGGQSNIVGSDDPNPYHAATNGTIGGGANNTVGGPSSVVAGGDYNNAGGGAAENSIEGHTSVGGGSHNNATYEGATIAGGENNTAFGTYNTVSGGSNNYASGFNYTGFNTIGGGYQNVSGSGYIGIYATVSGGSNNNALGSGSFVGGGYYNNARGVGSFVGGGGSGSQPDSNSALGQYSVVVGGIDNIASDTSGVVGGGGHNFSLKPYSTINGGLGNTCGVLGQPYGTYTTVGGGFGNAAYNDGCIVGGGESNSAGNINPGRPGNYATVGGGTNNNAFGPSTTISGGSNNLAGWYSPAGVGGNSTVGGGSNNVAYSEGGTIGGGEQNNIGGPFNTISGGYGNQIYGLNPIGGYCTICGGNANIAGWNNSIGGTVGGGQNDSSFGFYSTVPGGLSNKAFGDYSFAAGQQAKALHTGTFVWADNSNADFSSSTTNEFSVRATGGTRIFSNTLLTAGVTLAPGASAWASVSDSTMKRNARLVNGTEILDKVINLPIKRWSYKAQDPSIEHIGPMAQDFYAAFGVGDNNKTISTIDPSGVALAAIQELAKQNKLLTERVVQLETQLKSLMEQKQASASGNASGTK